MSKKIKLFSFIRFSLLMIFFSSIFMQISWADEGFRKWLEDFKQMALSKGITEKTYQEAFKNITEPDPDVLKRAKYQPEFHLSPEKYLDNHVTKYKIAEGMMQAEKWRTSLKEIEERFQVPAPYLLAIWSMESNYGAIFSKPHVLKDAIRSLATLSYGDPKRKKYATRQLIAALEILQNGDITRNDLLGSWAGALGQTQFIPTSYQIYAVDMDGDGKKDIWSSIPDALATAANLLHINGWKFGESWGFEIIVPTKKMPDGKHSLKEWSALKLKKINGEDFPATEQKARLKILKGDKTSAFLVFDNFSVIRCYNRSDLYALAVGLLGDEISKKIKSERANEIPPKPNKM